MSQFTGSHIHDESAPFFAVAEGNVLESKMTNIAVSANMLDGLIPGGTMKRLFRELPDFRKKFIAACLDGSMLVGDASVFTSWQKGKNVFALGVQALPIGSAKLRNVESSLSQAMQIIRDDDLLDKELAIPALGSGRGKLPWKEVEPVVRALAAKYRVKVVAYVA